MDKKTVAFFTTFFEARSGYSLVSVTETMLREMLAHNYQPVVLVQSQYIEDKDGNVSVAPFEEVPPPSVWNSQTVDLRSVVPAMRLEDGVGDDFEDRVSEIYKTLSHHLAGVDVCITQDIVLQSYYLPHNVAMRRVAEGRPDLLWLHWIHSCPSPVRKMPAYPHSSRHVAPPGYVVYPNNRDHGVVCSAYNLAGQEWRVKVCRFGHAIDPLLAWPYDRLTKDLARASDLLGGEIVAVYPARLDKGKQPEKIIRLLAGVQKAGYEVRLLVVDWQSQGSRFQKYIDNLLVLAGELGLCGKVHFTSRIDDRCSQGVPRHVVMELFDLSNVYVHPSMVETYGLTIHEAMLRGKLCVLNYDFPATQELFGDGAIYFDFGSDRNNRSWSSPEGEQEYWDGEALRLIAEYKSNRALVAQSRARLEWTPQALWKEFEPLLYLQPVAGEKL